MKTTTLFNLIKSKLIEAGYNEFVNEEGELVLFNEEYQFMQKIIRYDNEVAEIMNDLFYQLQLDDLTDDTHFKKTFLFRFLNRQINRQTVEAFQLELMGTFLTHQPLINELYSNINLYITGASEAEQQNTQKNDGKTVNDHRQAFTELPQSTVNLDVDNTVLNTANENTISRNKQANQQTTEGSTLSSAKSYQLDTLLKSSQAFENIFLVFDSKCFLQIW